MVSHTKWGRGLFVGTFTVGMGLLVRANARRLAWPTEFGYSGARASTIWAFEEELYNDLGRILMLLGCGFFVVLFYQWLQKETGKETPP